MLFLPAWNPGDLEGDLLIRELAQQVRDTIQTRALGDALERATLARSVATLEQDCCFGAERLGLLLQFAEFDLALEQLFFIELAWIREFAWKA